MLEPIQADPEFQISLFSFDKKECLETNFTAAIPLYYQPVCGCNDVTYPNWETAECHGILNYKEGECEKGLTSLCFLS